MRQLRSLMVFINDMMKQIKGEWMVDFLPIILIQLFMSHFSYLKPHYRNKYSSNSESQCSKNSLQQPQLTQQQKYNQMLLLADELIRKEEFDQGINKLRLLMEKVNLSKQNKKDYDKKLELVIIYNLAAAFQKQWNLDQCIPLLEKFIALTKLSLQENLKSSANLNLHQQSTNKHWFKLKTILIKSLLQYCAVLSQIGQHKKAMKMAVDITSELKQLFKRGYEECNKLIAKKQLQQQKKGNSNKKIESSKSINADKIQFSYSVLLNARTILQELVRMETFSQIIDSNYSQIQSEMKEVKSKIYYWKSNPENNIKMLRQSFNANEPVEQDNKKATSQRNLLGIKRNQSWVEQFTIAKIMFMAPINYLQFCDYDNLIFEFNQRNIIEKVILLSVTYFSLSIELRFLEEDQNKGSAKKIKLKQSKEAKIQQKKEEQLQKSQIFHLKSIEVVCRHIKQNSAFVSHLVINYHKHYKNNLNTIQQQNSIAEYSELYDVRRHSRNNTIFDYQQMMIPIESVRNSHKDAPTPNTYRKDSVYYTDAKQEVEETKEKEKQKEKIEGTVFSFKKINKKKLHENEQKSQRSRKLGSSSSFSKFDNDLNSQKDKTLKKMSSSKIITLGKLNDIRIIITDRSQKDISSKQTSMKSIDKKSLSKSKNFLKNSITLKQNKSQSPQKDRSKAKQICDLKQSKDLKESKTLKESKDLKQSKDFGKRDFAKKKSPQPSRALDLFKKSGNLNDMDIKSSKDLGSIRNMQGSPLSLKKKI